MTVEEIADKWLARREEWRRLEAHVAGAAIAEEILADLDAIARAEARAISLTEASAIGGYSAAHLQRLVARGTIENVGRKHAPRIRLTDVPRKAGLREGAGGEVLSDRRRIVDSAIRGGV